MNALGHLGVLQETTLGQMDLAITSYEQQLAIARKLGSSPVESNALGHLASIYQRKRETERAIQLSEAGLAAARKAGALLIDREVGSRRSEGHTLANIARVDRESCEIALAVSHQQAALEILESVGDNIVPFARSNLDRWIEQAKTKDTKTGTK